MSAQPMDYVREDMPRWARQFPYSAVCFIVGLFAMVLMSLSETALGAARIDPDNVAAFSSDYPPIGSPALQDELLSLLLRARPLTGQYPPSEFSDVTHNHVGASFGPYCYMPSVRRHFFKNYETVNPGPGGGREMFSALRAECNTLIFAGRHGSETAWIVVYNIPVNVAGIPDATIRYERDHQHLLIIPMRSLQTNGFPAAARERALSEFNRP
jgi:hypothetical protein